MALDGVSFNVLPDQIVGVIGPNGAGKTTLFNCLSRLYPVDQGDILFRGRSILKKSTHAVSRIGIGRTFQNLALFRNLSVLDNVLIGAHRLGRSNFLSDGLALRSNRRRDRKLHEQALALLADLGLEAYAGQPVAQLPFGTQKRVELARALAARPQLLLLDEPAGGLNHDEVTVLIQLIRNLRIDYRLAIVLVEHHMHLVMQVSDQVVVLNFGRKIASGTPAEVQRHEGVIKAYLGAARGLGG